MHQKRTEAIRRIREEYIDIQSNPLQNITSDIFLPDETNIFNWKVSIFAPSDTPYKGGLFHISFTFPNNYPASPPKVIFITPIYHLNVNSKRDPLNEIGKPDLSILKSWKPEFKVKDIIVSIFALFYMNNVNCTFSNNKANEFRNNKYLYLEKIKYFTEKYANPSASNTNLQRWDFTFLRYIN